MHAFIITGDPASRQQKSTELLNAWQIHPVDMIILDTMGEHIGITEVRMFQKQLLLAPLVSEHKAGIIKNADLLTVDAQNALLKLFEEPPPHTYILCLVQSADTLLPTIRSRCEILSGNVMSLTDTEEREVTQTIQNILTASVGNKLAIIESVAGDRLQAKQWTQNAQLAVRSLLINASIGNRSQEHVRTYARLLRALMRASRQLEVNVNPKMVLDTAFLTRSL